MRHPIYPLPSSHVQPPSLSTSCTEWYICTHIDTSLSPKVHTIYQGSLSVIYSMSFNKCVMTYIYHYSAYRIVLYSKNPVYSFHPSPTPLPVGSGNHWSLIILFFPECHIVRIIQYVVFSDLLLLLSDAYLSSFHILFMA